VVLAEAQAVDPADWLLSANERGNPDTHIDSRNPGGLAWSSGNAVLPLPHGRSYFDALRKVVDETGRGVAGKRDR